MTASRKPWDIPPVYFVATLIVEIIIGLRVGAEFVYYPWQYLGVVFIVVGLALAAAAVTQFRRAETTPNPHEQSSALVTSGVYRLTRNPMYFGLFCLLVGAAFLLRRLIPFIFPFIFGWIVSRRFIEPEEERLQAQFGETYEQYRARVRRWL